MRFIRTSDVVELVGLSRSTLWRMVHAGTFPRRVRISERAAGHIYEEVQAWMEARARDIPPPPQDGVRRDRDPEAPTNGNGDAGWRAALRPRHSSASHRRGDRSGGQA